MRLCTAAAEGIAPFLGVELGGKILRLAAASAVADPKAPALPGDMMAFLQGLPKTEAAARKLLQRVAENPKAFLRQKGPDGHPVLLPAAKVRFLPPVPRPAKILCIGLNYHDHCAEQNAPLPDFPLVFAKFATSLLGHGAEIPLPVKVDGLMDYEGELAFVIGRTAKNVAARSAMKHVAGYTILHDVSARSLQKREKQWTRAKGFDGSAPCGPVLVTADEVPDPHALALETRLNGKTMQKSSTAQLIFKIPKLIAHITRMITLEPGDIVATGTPAGVGQWRNPPVYLKKGDLVEIEIERIGKLANRCG
ncbi:MAG: fumarylacetoacetate hydrolase family protein [Candidatus Sumerlaeia bacterium]|nr:fumarylacetoacetate hydrolase family protein [Candidatus Sumerlaeia bacterium]